MRYKNIKKRMDPKKTPEQVREALRHQVKDNKKKAKLARFMRKEQPDKIP